MHSTYSTITTPGDKKTEWKNISREFSGRTQEAIRIMKEFDAKAVKNLVPNTNENIVRVQHEHPGVSNAGLA